MQGREGARTHSLMNKCLWVKRQVELPVLYKGQTIGSPLRIDLIARDKIIIGCKAAMTYNSIFEAQILTYLRLTSLKLGMKMNFVERTVKDGIHRVVNRS